MPLDGLQKIYLYDNIAIVILALGCAVFAGAFWWILKKHLSIMHDVISDQKDLIESLKSIEDSLKGIEKVVGILPKVHNDITKHNEEFRDAVRIRSRG